MDLHFRAFIGVVDTMTCHMPDWHSIGLHVITYDTTTMARDHTGTCLDKLDVVHIDSISTRVSQDPYANA